MSKQLKFLIPVLVLTAMLVSGIGFALSQNNAVLAASPSASYQDNGSTLYCDPDNCPSINGQVCPGGGAGGTGVCPGQVGGRAGGCPCGGSR